MNYDLEMIRALWIEAQDDLESAKSLREKGRYSKVVYLCQQFMEKLMKMALACEGFEEIKSHEITGLFGKHIALKAPSKWKERLKSIGSSMRQIEKQYPKLRYPLRQGNEVWIPSQEYNESDAEGALKIAEEAKKVFLEFLTDCYKIEF